MNYPEIVKMLRENGNWLGFTEWLRDLFHRAADAIEEQQKRIAYLEFQIAEALDALDRGADNEWARSALEATEHGEDGS